jgi:uncharacterized protein (DUF1697 family)
MPGYVAFLRGMNVGGHRISGGELCAAFEELGFEDVSTFRASGNVIFAAGDDGKKATGKSSTGKSSAGSTGKSSAGKSSAGKSPPEGKSPTERETAARIEKGLGAALGYEVPVFLRTAGELRKIAAHEPFEESVVEASKGKLQVAMFSAKPTGAARKEVLAMASEEDRLAFGDRELYWLPSGGILDSVLDFNKAIRNLVGPMTTRTKNTIEQITTKYFSSN